jgi:hypothetical protein
MSTGDELDLMIQRVNAKRNPATPLYVTCAEVFYEFADEMSAGTFAALEETGRTAIEQEGQPAAPDGQPLPPVLAGFMAVVAESFMEQDGRDG